MVYPYDIARQRAELRKRSTLRASLHATPNITPSATGRQPFRSMYGGRTMLSQQSPIYASSAPSGMGLYTPPMGGPLVPDPPRYAQTYDPTNRLGGGQQGITNGLYGGSGTMAGSYGSYGYGGGGGGGGLSGNTGGYGGVSGNTGGGGSLVDRILGGYQSAYDEARAANEERYQDILSGYSDLGEQERKDIRDRYRALAANAQSDLTSRGLSATTLMPAMRMGYARDETAAKSRLEEDLLRERLGFMERRTDEYPDQAFYANLLSQYGEGTGGGASKLTVNPQAGASTWAGMTSAQRAAAEEEGAVVKPKSRKAPLPQSPFSYYYTAGTPANSPERIAKRRQNRLDRSASSRAKNALGLMFPW